MWCCIPEEQRPHSRTGIWEMPCLNVCWGCVYNKCDFPQFLQAYLWIGQEHFVPNTTQCTIHYTILCHIVWDADIVVKDAAAKDFTFVWPCIVTDFLIIKPTICTDFSNWFWNETLRVSDSSSVHHQELFTVHTAMVYVIQVCRQLLSCLQTFTGFLLLKC
jgi:hypothetical protein